jgi:ATP-binding cassette subfamily B multidrug efflux pump
VTATVEGMRKLTTEIFDTVIMFIFYIAYLFLFDVTMTLYVLIPVFVAVLVAVLDAKAIFSASSQARKANGKMTASTYDLFDNAITYRIYGRDQDHLKDYDGLLADYEKKNVKASCPHRYDDSLSEHHRVDGSQSLFSLWGPPKSPPAPP